MDLTSWVKGVGSLACFPLESLLLHACLVRPCFYCTLALAEDAIEFARVEECKGIGAAASVDEFEARALGWYLKPRSKEVDASRRAKGNRN